MVARNPLVLVSGAIRELPTGDTVNGASGGGGGAPVVTTSTTVSYSHALTPGTGLNSIYRTDTAKSAWPYTSTVSSVAGTTLTLSSAVAQAAFEPTYMKGVVFMRIWNTTQNKSAWVSDAPTTSTFTVTSASDISTWVATDTIRLAEASVSGLTNTYSVALDISQMLQAQLGRVFRQSSITVGCVVIPSAANTDARMGIWSQLVSGAQSILAAEAVSELAGGIVQACKDLSPISNSNLIYLNDTTVSPTSISIANALAVVEDVSVVSGVTGGGGGGGANEVAYTKPNTATFATTRSGTGTIENSSWGVRLRAPSPNSNSNSLMYGVNPIVAGAGGWRATGRFRNMYGSNNWGMAGLILRNSSSGLSVLFCRGFDSTNGFIRNQYSNDTTWNSVAGLFNFNETNYWLRVTDDNTNRIVEFSVDGEYWGRLYIESRTTYVTPDQVGIVFNPNFGTGTDLTGFRHEVAMECISWSTMTL